MGVLEPIGAEHGVELGGFILPTDAGFTYGEILIGGNSRIHALTNVPNGAVGAFHTHPKGISSFSYADASYVRGRNGTKIPLYAIGSGQVRVCETSGLSCNPALAGIIGGAAANNRYLQGRVVH